jgi:hypothetical protein
MRSTAILVAFVGLVRVAQADDAADAEKLFAEGHELKEHGQPEKACVKFRAALEKNRNAVGTILNVALCDEQAGKIASAYKLWVEAADRAREQNLDEHRKAAEEHKAKLGVQVPYVAIAFSEPLHDMKLVVDDEIVDPNNASEVAVDPGTATVVVTAPGRVAYKTSLAIAVGEHKAIAIPPLAEPVSAGRQTVGKVLTFTGAGVVGIGIGVGVYARHKYNSQFPDHCTSSATPACDPTGYAATQNAKTLGWVGTGVGAAGIVAAGIGAFLWFTAPRTESANVAVVPSVSPDQAGIAAVGRF